MSWRRARNRSFYAMNEYVQKIWGDEFFIHYLGLSSPVFLPACGMFIVSSAGTYVATTSSVVFRHRIVCM